MADIKINDIQNLRPAGSDFFGDSESYMSELTEDAINVWGGTGGISGAVSGQVSTAATGFGSAVSGEVSGVLPTIPALPTLPTLPSAASAISF